MIRIVIADDHNIFRDGLKLLLAEETDFKLVGEATRGHGLLAQLASTPCDVVLLDLSMPGLSGIALVEAVCKLQGGHSVIVLSMHDEHQYVAEAMRAGARGYVTKNSASGQLIAALRTVASGGLFVSADASAEATRAATSPGGCLPHTRLTPREREVFDLLVAGRKMSHIARDFGLSIKTVSTHKANVLAKMGAETTTELVRYALRHGLG